MELTLADIKIWEPTVRLSLTQEQLCAQSWRAMCFGERKAPRAVFVEVFPSAKHPRFVHYEVWDVTGQQSWTSKKSVMASHVGDFIEHALKPLGYSAAELKWSPIDKPPGDREPVAASTKTGEFVYFLSAGPFIKIGKSTGRPDARIRELQTGCPYPLTLIAHIVGGLREEFALHKRFAQYRTHGEWFKHEGELAAHIRVLAGATA